MVEILVIIVVFLNPLFAQQSQRALFNGKNLDGWTHVGPGSMVVEDGMIKTEDGMGLLWYTRERVGHATLRVVFKFTGKESDSRVFIRIPENPPSSGCRLTEAMKSKSATRPTIYSCTGVLYTFTKALARPIRPIASGMRWR
jgi:hypothetical protein